MQRVIQEDIDRRKKLYESVLHRAGDLRLELANIHDMTGLALIRRELLRLEGELLERLRTIYGKEKV